MYTNTSYICLYYITIIYSLKQSQIFPNYLTFRFINVIIDQNTKINGCCKRRRNDGVENVEFYDYDKCELRFLH